MNRRAFWKFFAAAPVAAVGSIAGVKDKPEIPAEAIVIDGGNITITGVNFEDAPITIKPGANVHISGCYFTSERRK